MSPIYWQVARSGIEASVSKRAVTETTLHSWDQHFAINNIYSQFTISWMKEYWQVIWVLKKFNCQTNDHIERISWDQRWASQCHYGLSSISRISPYNNHCDTPNIITPINFWNDRNLELYKYHQGLLGIQNFWNTQKVTTHENFCDHAFEV